MASLFDIINIEKRLANPDKMYKSVAIFPKDIQNKEVHEFSEEEKKHLTRKLYRWKVIYKFWDENNSRWKQFAETFHVNRNYPDFNDRHKWIRLYHQETINHLKRGFNPFGEPKDVSKVRESLLLALSIKEKEVKLTTYKDYKSRVNQFIEYLESKGVDDISKVGKSEVSVFLSTFSSRNSNNTKAVLSSIFNILSDNSIIETNFIKELRNKKVHKKVSVSKTIPKKDIDKCVEILRNVAPDILMFIKVSSYFFLRPIEVVRLEDSNIHFKENRITEDTKSKSGKVKIIPSIIKNELYEYIGETKGYLFTPDGSGKWERHDSGRRDYYTKTFSKIRANHGINPDLKIYSFRYYYITHLYLVFRKNLSIKDSITKLSLITGHTSNAVWNYIQVNDIELPEDYSDIMPDI